MTMTMTAHADNGATAKRLSLDVTRRVIPLPGFRLQTVHEPTIPIVNIRYFALIGHQAYGSSKCSLYDIGALVAFIALMCGLYDSHFQGFLVQQPYNFYQEQDISLAKRFPDYIALPL